MKFSHFFIDRPIFATVISVVITIAGSLAYFALPVSQYPEVAPPTVIVTTAYPGATPQVVAETVATPIEQEVNGVENMLYMTSQCTQDGAMQLTVTFRLGTDLDTAQVLVQNRVAIAEPRLPEEVRRIGVTTQKSSPDLLMVVHLVSPDRTYDQLYISNYAYLRVRDMLSRLDGVGQVRVLGGSRYSMRLWLDTDRLGAMNLTAGDVVEALRQQNVQVAAGVVGQPPNKAPGAFQLPVSALGRLTGPEQFGEVILRNSPDGRLVRVKDVARMELDAEDYAVRSYLDDDPAVALVISQRPGSNALQTAERVQATMEELSRDFPPGLAHQVVYNPTVFVEESIDAVLHTLFEAAALVAVTVFVFLQSWRATLIPLVAIPVSLVGTFAVMLALRFGLNNLSLFGLVLAIGIVVDDAIVVVETVERNLRAGMAPKEATRRAIDEIGGALVATALVLAAVFVPTAFVSGISGQFYRQFALTIAVSTAFSAFVSLTLSPALAALLLKAHGAKPNLLDRAERLLLGWFFRLFGRALHRLNRGYTGVVGKLIRVPAVALTLYIGLIGLTWLGFARVPTGFIPPQDQGYFIVAIQLPDGASLDRTDALVQRAIRESLATPGVEHAVAFVGFSGATRTNSPNTAAIFTGLLPYEERLKRRIRADATLAELRRRLAAINDAAIVVIPPPPVQGLGTGGGFKMQIQDRAGVGLPALQAAADRMVAEANKDPATVQVFSTLRTATPQLYADVDRTRARMLSVPIPGVFETLQVSLGSLYVNDFNLLGRTWRVTAQAESRFRDDPADVSQLKARGTTGAAVPLGSLVEMKEVVGPDRVVRYNLYPAADVNGDTGKGFSTGQSLAAMERLAGELPDGLAFEWTDIAYQQRAAGNTAIYIFPLCVLFVFLTLAAQYESWLLPLAVILIVPMCLLCAIAGVALRGLDNNILTQIGFVVLVGLACKNAILIVEFAKQQEDRGLDRFSAAVEACRLRLRPILMTSFAFILGVVPLVIAEGAGAEMRRALGTAVFSGMLGVTFFGLLLTPVFYVVLRKLPRRGTAGQQQPQAVALDNKLPDFAASVPLDASR